MNKKDVVIKSLKPIIAKLKKSGAVIARERDKMRNLIDEISSIDESAEDAIASLDEACDYLSQYL